MTYITEPIPLGTFKSPRLLGADDDAPLRHDFKSASLVRIATENGHVLSTLALKKLRISLRAVSSN